MGIELRFKYIVQKTLKPEFNNYAVPSHLFALSCITFQFCCLFLWLFIVVTLIALNLDFDQALS